MELLPLLDAGSAEPLYSQLYRHIRAEIEAGRLAPDTRLPSVRKLAAHLGISRTPVEDAYQQLLAEGYTASKPKSGITVLAYEPDFEPAGGRPAIRGGADRGEAGRDAASRGGADRGAAGRDAASRGAADRSEANRDAANRDAASRSAASAAGKRTARPLITAHASTPSTAACCSPAPSVAVPNAPSAAAPGSPAASPGGSGLPAAAVGSGASPAAGTAKTAAAKRPALAVDFAYGDIDLRHFPFPLWKKLLGSCFLPEHRDLFRYGDPLGEIGFRRALSDYAYRARAVVCPAERIVVGAGTHHSIEQLCRLLPGTPYGPEATAIAVEQSMSDGIAAILRQHGYRLAPLRLAPDGIRIEDLYASGATVVYTTPSHQFPHGMVMSIGKRRRLLNWAAEVGGLILEDDYDGEFRYTGLPIPSLQGLDAAAADYVVYTGTFSRALAPAFRLSYTALPPALAESAKAALHPFDRLASPLHQRTLELFMAGGHMQKHIRKMRGVYQRKRAVLLDAVRRRLEPGFRASGGGAGLHVLLEPADGRGEAQAAEVGVRVYPTSVYRIEQGQGEPASVLLGFGGLTEADIEEGVRLLSEAWGY